MQYAEHFYKWKLIWSFQHSGKKAPQKCSYFHFIDAEHSGRFSNLSRIKQAKRGHNAEWKERKSKKEKDKVHYLQRTVGILILQRRGPSVNSGTGECNKATQLYWTLRPSCRGNLGGWPTALPKGDCANTGLYHQFKLPASFLSYAYLPGDCKKRNWS